MVSPARLCIICKGSRRLCGWRVCPLYSRIQVIPRIEHSLGKEFFGPSTSVFVGHNFYPNVYAGPLASLDSENLETIDSPQEWFGKPYGEIIRFRSLVLRSKSRENIFSRSKFVEQNQELALAKKPTDVELGFKKVPRVSFEFSDITQPMGPSGSLKKFRITENPKIPQRVEKIVRDEIKAREAVNLLYKKDTDVYKIITILSSGVLGLDQNKKMVPTRWSISGVHDMLANQLIKEIKQYQSISEFMVYSSEYLDNHFEILLMPGNWEFENFEAWSPGSSWSFNLKKTEILEEYEPYTGRNKYAELQGGGFYSSRLGVTEGLVKLRKQAKVVVFREIHEGYTIPLGCWQILENARNAFRQNCMKFDTKEEALKYIDSKIRLPIIEYLKQSVILKQKRLSDF